MKKAFFITLIIAAFISCKNGTKSESKESEENAGLTLLKGDFIYYADASVLQTPTEVYGVVIDEQMLELDKQVQKYKKEATDMVLVEIRGKIVPKPENEEGWPFRVEIKEILNIYQPIPEETTVVKLSN